MPNQNEFEATASRLFAKLAQWSGESIRTGDLDDDEKARAKKLMDPGRIAALRKGLKGGCDPIPTSVWVIEPEIPWRWKHSSSSYMAIYHAALLYTRHPYSHTGSFREPITEVFRKSHFVDGVDLIAEDHDAMDLRINSLIRANRDLVIPLLSLSLPVLMRTNDPVDWVQLSWDLRQWEDPLQSVQLRWTKGWYRLPRLLRLGEDERG